MSTVEPTAVVGPEATALAAATAKVAHGGVEHGDNAPDQSDMLRVRVAVVDSRVPRKIAVDDDRPMIYRRYRDPAVPLTVTEALGPARQIVYKHPLRPREGSSEPEHR